MIWRNFGIEKNNGDGEGDINFGIFFWVYRIMLLGVGQVVWSAAEVRSQHLERGSCKQDMKRDDEHSFPSCLWILILRNRLDSGLENRTSVTSSPYVLSIFLRRILSEFMLFILLSIENPS